MGADSNPLIAGVIAIATVESVLAGGSVMAGDALAGIMPWRGNRADKVQGCLGNQSPHNHWRGPCARGRSSNRFEYS